MPRDEAGQLYFPLCASSSSIYEYLFHPRLGRDTATLLNISSTRPIIRASYRLRSVLSDTFLATVAQRQITFRPQPRLESNRSLFTKLYNSPQHRTTFPSDYTILNLYLQTHRARSNPSHRRRSTEGKIELSSLVSWHSS